MTAELTLIRLDREFGGDRPGDRIVVLESAGRLLVEGGVAQAVGDDGEARALLRRTRSAHPCGGSCRCPADRPCCRRPEGPATPSTTGSSPEASPVQQDAPAGLSNGLGGLP